MLDVDELVAIFEADGFNARAARTVANRRASLVEVLRALRITRNQLLLLDMCGEPPIFGGLVESTLETNERSISAVLWMLSQPDTDVVAEIRQIVRAWKASG